MYLFKIIIVLFSFIFIIPLKSEEIYDCLVLTEKYGKEFKLPNKLLTSISFVESGLKKNKKYISWPWTLNVDGKAKYFDTKKEALDYLRQNNSKKKNIDVGCMQISTKFHAKEFDSLNQILDPVSNVKYAAKFLRQLYKVHKTWNEAISRYHSSVPERKEIYLNKVYSFWNKLRQKKISTTQLSETKTNKKIKYFRKELKKQNYM
ncbi:MAG: hypothetical protein CMP34_01150 [Rickettsiales bacterium]|nr:hypothetical protein [Rickettsiales bacterium]|tara:strand:- start:3767 stop:4381 length:615 start_codon:yes stop_codon:yes gene_type:complete